MQPGCSSSTLSSIAAGMLFTRQSIWQENSSCTDWKHFVAMGNKLSKPYLTLIYACFIPFFLNSMPLFSSHLNLLFKTLTVGEQEGRFLSTATPVLHKRSQPRYSDPWPGWSAQARWVCFWALVHIWVLAKALRTCVSIELCFLFFCFWILLCISTFV